MEIILCLFEIKGMRLDAREILNLNKKNKYWFASSIATWEGLINEYFVPDIFFITLVLKSFLRIESHDTKNVV